MAKRLPRVAIVGRPNVGKSTLFNRLIQKRLSITSDIEGTTRDRVLHKVNWLNNEFVLIDTAGYINDESIDFQLEMNTQIEVAMKEADVVLFLASHDSITKEDMIAAAMVKKIDKPILFVVNKVDNKEKMDTLADFYKLGLGEPIGVSSIHGIGIGDLLDKIMATLPSKHTLMDTDNLKIGFVGKPNVGKSTLVNAFLNDDRVIVSPIAGTTRDAIDAEITYNDKIYTITDTAGIKRNKKALDDIEWYAELRSNLTINGSDVIVMMLDATQGITQIDERIMAVIMKEKRPSVIVVNKADLLSETKRKEVEDDIRMKFKFVPFVPILFVSALTKKHIQKIFKEIESIQDALEQKIPTSQLNRFIMELQMIKKAPRHNGRDIKMKYITYQNKGIPTFIIFSNYPQDIHFSYKRFVENQLRIIFNFQSIPLIIKYKRS